VSSSVTCCSALTLCRTELSRLSGGGALGPLTSALRSSDGIAEVEEWGKATETERAKVDPPIGAALSTTLCLAVIETVRLCPSAGTGGMGTVGGARTDMGRPPAGRGDGGRLFRIIEPDLTRVVKRGL